MQRLSAITTAAAAVHNSSVSELHVVKQAKRDQL